MTREEAIKTLKGEAWSFGSKEYREAFDMAIKALEQEPRKGHWISHREHCEMNNLIPSGLGILYWCSECDCAIDSKYFHRVNYNFCPNCGADMREVEE